MVNHELTGRNFLGKHFNVVTAFKGILTVSAHVRVACVGFKVVFREPMVFKPVKGFAGVLCESVDGFFEAHVFAVGDDVIGKSLPAVFDFGIGLLHAGAVGGKKTAAEVRTSVKRAHALIKNLNLGAAVKGLAGSHEACAAAA